MQSDQTLTTKTVMHGSPWRKRKRGAPATWKTSVPPCFSYMLDGESSKLCLNTSSGRCRFLHLLFEISSAPEVLLIAQMSEGRDGGSTMLLQTPPPPKKTLNDQSQTIISNQTEWIDTQVYYTCYSLGDVEVLILTKASIRWILSYLLHCI